jgi:hypothetical protein
MSLAAIRRTKRAERCGHLMRKSSTPPSGSDTVKEIDKRRSQQPSFGIFELVVGPWIKWGSWGMERGRSDDGG